MMLRPGLDIENFHSEIRPQDDLFLHTNGVWLEQTEIPADKAVYGSFHMLRDASEDNVRAILDEAANDPQPGASQMIGDLYKSFLDIERVNALGGTPIAADLERIKTTEFAQLPKLMGQLARQGVNGLFGLYVNNDPGNPERYLVHFYQSGLGLPDESYYREEKYAEFRDAYVPFVASMLKLAGWADAESAAAAEAIMKLETQIASHHWDVVETRDAAKTYNLKTFAELQSLCAGFDWNGWLAGLEVSAELLDESVVMMPSFFEAMPSILNSDNEAAVRLWLSWQVISGMSAYLSEDFVETHFDFYGKRLTGQPEQKERWKRGVALVEGTIGEAVGQVYVERHFPPAAKARMDELVGWLVSAYEESISNITWMGEETRAKALEKLSKFRPKVGYPDKWKDYSDLSVAPDDLVGNVRRAAAWETEFHCAKIGSPIDRDEWFMTPQTVNAYYNPGFNEIVFPAAILQPPFFSLSADDAVNFGGIGAVIGHEIGHGFDDQGSKYDGDGAMRTWWTDADRAAFEQLTQALIAQYDALVPAGLSDEYHVNGALTIGENIGDLGGIMIAYKAYLLSLKGAEPEVIDGLTGAQRFFLSWGQIWRGKSREAIAIQRLATDPHSPSEFRCNQIARNFDSFYEAFGVTPEDAMWLDPAERVSIW